VEAHSNINVALFGILHVDQRRVGSNNGFNGKRRDAFRVIVRLILHKVADSNVRVTNGFDLRIRREY
jgi:hypothetical protein